ncbi:MAG: mannose-1-phosphate guanylyltransferase [Phycisphaerae bacterium]|nr:mannose-1-phosphate guanylyltransferase [Tepidisphaeraceae bacterium]
MEYAVIMAGGRGARLWPFSRNAKPKQLLPVVRGRSLLQLSYERLRALLPPERIFVCTAAAHRPAVLENLPELSPDNVLGEPEGRDTAAAVGFPATVLLQRDKDAVIAIVTADHVIEPVEKFVASLKTAFAVVREHPRALVTFGLVPTYGHTGLGYIHRGEPLSVTGEPTASAYRVMAFKEKPDKATADRYVESGRYYWNSGMFVWRCDTVLDELRSHLPETAAGLEQIGQAWNTADRDPVLRRIYSTLVKKSIDYAIMEPASLGKGKAHVVVVQMDVQWLDVGSWPALAETIATDDHDNAVDARLSVMIDSFNNIVVSHDPKHMVAMVGVNDMIVVHTPDATMLCPKSEAQRVKDLVDRVKEKTGEQHQ